MAPKDWLKDQIYSVLDSERIIGDNARLAESLAENLFNNWLTIWMMTNDLVELPLLTMPKSHTPISLG